MSASIEREFLNFIDKKSSRHLLADMQRGGSEETSTHSSSTGNSSGRKNLKKDAAATRGGLSQSMHNHKSSAGPPPNRRTMLTKSLSKEDLHVEKVDAFGADDDFNVDWDAAGKQLERKNLARSRRLGPGDRRKELMRRGSSRRLLTSDSQHSSEGGGHSLDGGERSLSNRSLGNHSNHTNTSRRTLITNNLRGSARGLQDPERVNNSSDNGKPKDTDGENPNDKMTTKGLKEEMELSFSDLPKEWQVTPASNQLGASFLPGPRKTSFSTSGNPRVPTAVNSRVNRRASLSGPTPALQRRLSQRGLIVPPMDEEEPEPTIPAPTPTAHHPRRRHSLMGSVREEAVNEADSAAGGRPVRMQRQRSRRLASQNSGEVNDNDESGDQENLRSQRQRSRRVVVSQNSGEGRSEGGRQRTTTVPRRMSNGANCRDLRNSNRASAKPNSLMTGEAVSTMGGVSIRW